MTSGTPAQPPAAPETDVRLTEERDEWLSVARIRMLDTALYAQEQRARAESAEAAHEALRKGIEALADEWDASEGRTWIASLADDLRALLAGGAS